MIGFDATETHRSAPKGNDTYVTSSSVDAGRYLIQYPLQTWGWDRARCEREIAAAGLPVPEKSACFMCPASKKQEIVELSPRMYGLSVGLERRYRSGKHWRGDQATTVGLGRKFRWEDVDRDPDAHRAH